MEEDHNSEEIEVTPQDQESQVVEEQEQETYGEPQGQEADPQEKNWRELRNKAEEAERQRRQYEEKLKMQDEFIKSLLSQSQQQKQAPQPPQEVDEFADIPDDEYLSKGQARKLNQKDARQIAREEFLALERERESKRFKERLQARYSDFDDVVNAETIALLEKNEPELATTIADLKDPYKMGLQSYKFIKSLGLNSSPDENRHSREVKKKIEANEKTIQSPQAYNKRPMAQAFSMANMSADEKQKIYEEMLGYASMSPGY